jgi:hypothetical protein
MLGARRGNGRSSNRDPPTLATHRLQPPYPPVPLSSKEVITWEAHKQVVRAWGWDLSQITVDDPMTRLGNERTATAEEVQVPGDIQHHHSMNSYPSDPDQPGTLLLNPPGTSGGSKWVLTSIPLVYGVPLGAGDLCTYLQQLAGTRTGTGQAVHQGPDTGGTAVLAAAQGATANYQTVAAVQPLGTWSRTHQSSAVQPAVQPGVLPVPRIGALPVGVLRVLRSRACRTAIMFGDELEPADMEGLVR